MKTIRVGGVPEHFNLPWHLAIDDGTFKKNNLHVTWRDFPDGTGGMCRALRNEEIDIAIILTEGIIKDILNGNESKIVQEYIATPLIWGIHVDAKSGYRKLEDLKEAKVAISRYGSGSHLMAYVNAKNLGWDPKKLDFVEVGDINGGIDALREGKAGYFMWEHFTTKPLVDKGIFRRIGDCPTPWSCFVLAVRNDFLKKNPAALQTTLTVLNSVTSQFKEIPGIDSALAKKYDQKVDDIRQWLKLTTWSQKQISVMEIQKVQEQLLELGLIDEKKENAYFLANNFT